MTEKLPLFYYKPTICWVDDDKVFLEATNIYFEKFFPCKSFNKPNDALEYFLTYKSPISSIEFKHEFTESDRYGANHHYPVNLNIPAIKNIQNMPEKTNEIAVLIIDYNMPEMDGLELCKALKHLPMKKILLTGNATNEKAIEAFNDGLIDRFIVKDLDTSTILHKYIEELTTEYFYEKSMPLISHIEASRQTLLTDEEFIGFFSKWRKKKNIQEFYLANKQGCFLVKNTKGQLSYFVAMSKSDIEEFIRLNDELRNELDECFTNTLKGKLIPFFGVENESWEIETTDWERHFYPCGEILGRESYYWAEVSK